MGYKARKRNGNTAAPGLREQKKKLNDACTVLSQPDDAGGASSTGELDAVDEPPPPPLDPFGPLGNVGRGLVAYDSDSDDGESPRTALVRVCAESNDACCY